MRIHARTGSSMLLYDDEDRACPRERAGAGVIKINKESMQEIKNQKKRSASQLPEHLQVCRVTHLNASCHIYIYIYYHIYIYIYYLKEYCHIFGRVMSYIWMRHVTHLNELCLPRVSCIWRSHVPLTKHKRVMSHKQKQSALLVDCQNICRRAVSRLRMTCVAYLHASRVCLGWYGVATIRRLLKITGLFCKRAL